MDGMVVSDPVEEGSFTTYNKTSAPVSIDIMVSFQGDKASLQEAITKVKELKEGLTTFSIVTPYYEFESMTLERLSYDMKVENGLGVLIVTMTCIEVKEVEAAYTSVSQTAIQAAQCANASNASTVNTGQTTTSTPTGEEQEKAEEDKTLLKIAVDTGKSIYNRIMGNEESTE